MPGTLSWPDPCGAGRVPPGGQGSCQDAGWEAGEAGPGAPTGPGLSTPSFILFCTFLSCLGLAWNLALGGGTDRTLAPAVVWAREGSQEGFLEEMMPQRNPVLFSPRKMCPGSVCKRRKAEAALTQAGLCSSGHPQLPASFQAPESTDSSCPRPA